MKTAAIHTWYDFMDGGRYSTCTRDQSKPIDHSCETGVELTITIPDGYRLGENEGGDVLLVPVSGGENQRLLYDTENGVIFDFWTLAPINGVKIVGRKEY